MTVCFLNIQLSKNPVIPVSSPFHSIILAFVGNQSIQNFPSNYKGSFGGEEIKPFVIIWSLELRTLEMILQALLRTYGPIIFQFFHTFLFGDQGNESNIQFSVEFPLLNFLNTLMKSSFIMANTSDKKRSKKHQAMGHLLPSQKRSFCGQMALDLCF